MIGVNENGYVFWDHVYKTNIDPIPNIVNPTVAESFKKTFPKIRLFHLIDKDYETPYYTYTHSNGSTYTLSPTQVVNNCGSFTLKGVFDVNGDNEIDWKDDISYPCNGCVLKGFQFPCQDQSIYQPYNLQACDPNEGSDLYRESMYAIRDFYKHLKADGYYVSSASAGEGAKLHGFPSKWFSPSEWGTDANYAKAAGKDYMKKFLETMDPGGNFPQVVDRFYTSNELWGWCKNDATIYKAVCEGFIEGKNEYYQNSNDGTKIELWLGAFQAYSSGGAWGSDYVGDMISTIGKQELKGIDIHPYSFSINDINNNNPGKFLISEHPESSNSFFKTIKSMVNWRNNNAPGLEISASEFGWNSDDCYGAYVNGWPSGRVSVVENGVEYWVIPDANGNPSTSNSPSSWGVIQEGVGEEAQALYTTRAYLMLARYGLESGYIYGSLNNDEIWFQNCGVYKTTPDIQPAGNTGYYTANFSTNDFNGEKLVMPAMRKLGNSTILGDKRYLEVLKEEDNGVYAMLFGDGAGNPTHLVAWNAVNINKLDENAIDALTITETLANIGLPSNLSINTNQNFTRLDWHENDMNNISSSTVFNASTNELTLTPIPVVIPLKSNTTIAATIQVASNQCISLGGVGSGKVKCKSPSSSTFVDAPELYDASDATLYTTGRLSSFIIDIDDQPKDKELILHWRSDSWQSRGGNNDVGLRKIKIYGTDQPSGNNWELLNCLDANNNTSGQYMSIWQDDYVRFKQGSSSSLTGLKRIKVEALDPNGSDIILSRLEVFTRPECPNGTVLRDDIWLFMGNSETNNSIIVGPNHDDATVFFGDQIYANTNHQYYPIIINGGYGGETAVAASQQLDGILASHPEISVVPFCYGLNDVTQQPPYPDPPLVPYDASWQSYNNSNVWQEQNYYDNMITFQNSLVSLINTCNNHQMLPIPARMPWAFFPNGIYMGYSDPTNTGSNSATWGTNGTTPLNQNIIDPIISQHTPYAIDPSTNLPFADFDTWFHDNAYDPSNPDPNTPNLNVFKPDKLHFQKLGTDGFNNIWVNTALNVVYNNQSSDPCSSSNTCHDYTITNNTTWPNAAYPGPYGKVEVKNGATLTIDQGYEARFCTDGELDIFANSKVILEGTLTAFNSEWKGVRLNDQAIFEGKPDALVTKALVGIQSVLGQYGYNSGTINCDQVDFIDNGVSVSLSQGTFPSTFERCTFESTAGYTNPFPHPRFVSLDWAQGVQFLGCSFEDKRTTPDMSEIGVYGFGSNFTVDKYQVSGGIPISSTFTHIPIGVVGSTFGLATPPFTVNHSEFKECGVGVHSDRVQGADIRHNRFEFDANYVPAGNGWFTQRQFGARIEGPVENFLLEDNDFIQNSGFFTNKTGTYVNNLGWVDNVIRDNRYNDMDLANVAYFTNGHPTHDVGLLYECNTMTNNDYDFYTDNLGLDLVSIKPHQGVNQGEPSNKWRSAANKFAYNNYSFDFHHSGSTAQPEITYHYVSSNNEYPDPVLNVILKSLDVVQNTCLRKLKAPGKDLTPSEKEVNQKNYLEYNAKYEVANQAYLDAKQAGDSLLMAQKLSEVSWARSKMTEAVTIALMAAIYDKPSKNRNDIRMWLRRYKTYEADLLLAEDFAGSLEWASAQNVLDMLPQKYELTEDQYAEINQIEDIFGILAKGEINKLDTESRNYLDELAKTNFGYGSAMARSIMSLYGKYYQPLVSHLNAKNSEGKQVNAKGDLVRLAISPNPADYNVRFDWSEFIIGSEQSVTIEITNKMGGLVQVLQPSPGQSGMEWTTEAVSAGIIYYRLLIDGKEFDAGQILINK